MEPKPTLFRQQPLPIVPYQQVERLLRWLQEENVFVPHIGLSYESAQKSTRKPYEIVFNYTLEMTAIICVAPICKKRLVKKLLQLLELIYYGADYGSESIDPQWLELVISRIS